MALVWEHSRKEEEGCKGLFPPVRGMPLEKDDANPAPWVLGPHFCTQGTGSRAHCAHGAPSARPALSSYQDGPGAW